MLTKNPLPILEYDDSQASVIDPFTRGNHYPERAVFAFLSDEIDKYALANNCERIDSFESVTKTYTFWRTTHKGKEVLLCTAPCGAAPAVQLLDHLIGGGCRKIVSAGCCGDLVGHAENTFLVPNEALRQEGCSYHYLPPSRTVALPEPALAAIELALITAGYAAHRCKTWTTDGFFRETSAMVEYRRAEGCEVVEMECAALAACAQFRGALFGQMLFTADSLADTSRHDMRDWGANSFSPALHLCLDAVCLL